MRAPFCDQASIFRGEPMLRFPGDGLDLFAEPTWRIFSARYIDGRRWYAQAASPTTRRRCALPVLVIAPRRTLWPVEYSLGTMPLYPINCFGRAKRDSGPTSATIVAAVRLDTPRRACRP